MITMDVIWLNPDRILLRGTSCTVRLSVIGNWNSALRVAPPPGHM